MKQYFLIAILILGLFLMGCAGTGGGFGSIAKTAKLSPNMPTDKVRNILGEPIGTEFVADKWIWKYSLHQYWKGFVPYYLVFGKESQKLEEWYANEEEYRQQQLLWLQAFPATQKHKVELNVR